MLKPENKMWAESYSVKSGKFMSRIGKKTISIPQGVTVSVDGPMVSVKGAKGELAMDVPNGITVEVDGEEVIVDRGSN